MSRDCKKAKIFTLYFLLGAGGVWHLLNLFQDLMREAASPLIIGLAIWLMIENWKMMNSGEIKHSSWQFIIWSLGVIVITIIIEGIGVKTGKIFGNYYYGSYLSPYIWGVPLAIGFAWLTVLLSSISLAELILKRSKSENIVISIFLAALLMTVFDFFMEPAAVRLNYWTWLDGNIPYQNYLAWLVISFILIASSRLIKILPQKLSPLGVHTYFAQLIYFFLVNMS